MESLQVELGFTDGSNGTLLMEAVKIQTTFRKKKKLTILARTVFVPQFGILGERENIGFFNKIMIFGSLYEDINEQMRTCQWK